MWVHGNGILLGLSCVIPLQGETPEGSTEARRVGMDPGVLSGHHRALLTEMLLVLAVLWAGSGYRAALFGVAVVAGWCSECLT